MITRGYHRDPGVVAIVETALAHLLERSSGLNYATVLTDDGFEVGTRRAEAVMNGDRFASIASSLQALGEAAVRELSIQGQSSVLVFSDAGHVVQVRVGTSPLVVAALFGSNETLGHALQSVRLVAAEIEKNLPGPASITPPAERAWSLLDDVTTTES